MQEFFMAVTQKEMVKAHAKICVQYLRELIIRREVIESTRNALETQMMMARGIQKKEIPSKTELRGAIGDRQLLAKIRLLFMTRNLNLPG